MDIKLYQVDAFTNQLFHGNPAAVCLLDAWLDDEILQKIAAENNLSETAFILKRDNDYHIRWFTPLIEVNLCGHATLAASYIVFNILEPNRKYVTFYSASGPLSAIQNDGQSITLDFPVLDYQACDAPAALIEGLGIAPVETYCSKDYLAILAEEKQVRDIRPNMELLRTLDLRGIIVSAKADHVDFVSRFFTPQKGVNEDPVTGSAHCSLAPFWAERLGKSKLHAKQLSARGGDILCEVRDDRVLLEGSAVLYLSGVIKLL